MKRFFAVIYFLIITVSVFSQTDSTKIVTLEINNVTTNGGIVYVSVFHSETAYKKDVPDQTFRLESLSNIIRTEITIPAGDCVISVYQDRNGNGICDTGGIFGIPKEPVGVTNWNGRGSPGNYKRLKVGINNTTRIIQINLYQL